MVQSTPFRWNLAGAGGEGHCSVHQVQLGDHAQLGELHSETITVTQQHQQIKAKDDQKPKILEWSHSLGLLNFGKEKTVVYSAWKRLLCQEMVANECLSNGTISIAPDELHEEGLS